MNNKQSTPNVPTYNISYDIIRFVAILIVFSIHCMAGLEANQDTIINVFVCNLLHSFQGIGVPLFVLLSGALLLNKQETPCNFLKKRTIRVLIPFFVWSIIVFVIYYIIEPSHYDEGSTPLYNFINVMFKK